MVGWEEDDEAIDVTSPAAAGRASRQWARPAPAVIAVTAVLLGVGAIVGLVWRPTPSTSAGATQQASAPNRMPKTAAPLPSTTATSPATVAGVQIRRAANAVVGPATNSSTLVTRAQNAGFVTIGAVAEGARVRLADGRVVNVLGLDTAALPESQACHQGALEAALAREIPAGTMVLVEADPADLQGLYLVRVSDGTFLNELLLWQGAAPAKVDGLKHRERLSDAAGNAVRNGRGIWAGCPGSGLPGGVEPPPVTVPGVPE